MKATRLAFAALAVGTLTAVTGQQEPSQSCNDMSYENRNQTDYGPLLVRTVKGKARDPQGVAMPGLCVGVFTEPGRKLVATAQTDDNGRFELKPLRGGECRLVAKYAGFCPANARLRVDPRSRSNKALILLMRPSGIDTCSYAEHK